MIDFEKLDGFVIDLRTKENVLRELEYVLSCEEDRESLLTEHKNDLNYLREFIMEYYLTTYEDDLIVLKLPNLYQNVETTNKTEQIFVDIAGQYDNCEDMINALRSLNSCGELTNEQYDYCIGHWDEMLEKYC